MNKDKGLLGKGVRRYVMGECKKEMNAQEILLLLQVKSLPGNKRCLNLQDRWQAVIAGWEPPLLHYSMIDGIFREGIQDSLIPSGRSICRQISEVQKQPLT